MADDNEIMEFDEEQYLIKLYEDDANQDIYASDNIIFQDHLDEKDVLVTTSLEDQTIIASTPNQFDDVNEDVLNETIPASSEQKQEADTSLDEQPIDIPASINHDETIQVSNISKTKSLLSPYKIRGEQKK